MQPDIVMELKTALNPENWVNNYADALFAFALPRVHDKQFAEDIVQSTFLSAWSGRFGYTGQASEKTWLFTICRNKIIDHYRKKVKMPLVAGEEELYFDAANHWTADAAPKEWKIIDIDPLDAKDFSEIFSLCKSKLKPVQQQVFSMKYLDDMMSEEICRLLGITLSNYWVLLHRAKLHLRECLEKNWVKVK